MSEAVAQAERSTARLIAVTGASRGIGSAIARALASAGFTVACLTRKGTGVEDRDVTADLVPALPAYTPF